MSLERHKNHQVLELRHFNQMPRKKKTNGDQPIGIGLTTKQMKRKKPIGNTYLLDIEPITEIKRNFLIHMQRENILLHMAQQGQGKHLFLYIMLLLMY